MKEIPVLSKEEAQEWLNRPEHEGAIDLRCRGKGLVAYWEDRNGDWHILPFTVDCVDILFRKTPWHWPKPDKNTPIDAKVWISDGQNGCIRAYYAGDNMTYDQGRASFTATGRSPSKPIVIANPDDLDEMPPMDLEV